MLCYYVGDLWREELTDKLLEWAKKDGVHTPAPSTSSHAVYWHVNTVTAASPRSHKIYKMHYKTAEQAKEFYQGLTE